MYIAFAKPLIVGLVDRDQSVESFKLLSDSGGGKMISAATLVEVLPPFNGGWIDPEQIQ